MSKNILVFFASLALVSHLAGCTSQGEKSEGGDEVSDVEALADESAPVTAAPTDAPAATSETLPEDALGAAPVDGAAAPNESVATNLPPVDAAPAPAPVEGDGLSLDAPAPAPVDPAAMGAVTDQQPPASTEAAPSENASIEPPPAATEPPPAEAKPVATLQKMADKPWTVGNVLFNGVYLARPGDSLKSISKTIYGEDRTKELKKGNPSLKFRGPKPGEKVYYHSAKRPDDAERVVNFYEESGLTPETYTAKAGDNIRKVSKQLLGYDNAWKEVWSTNSVDSKGELTEGTELKYFSPTQVASLKGAETVAAAETPVAPAPTGEALPPPPDHMAQNAEALPPPPVESALPPPPPQAELPPPPPVESAPAMGTASSDLPPPPPAMDAAADLPPPPPEPQAAMNDIPPPPPPMEASPSGSTGRKKKAHDEGGMDEDTTMALGAVAVIAAGAAAMLVVRRKRKQKDMESNFDSTHVGT